MAGERAQPEAQHTPVRHERPADEGSIHTALCSDALALAVALPAAKAIACEASLRFRCAGIKVYDGHTLRVRRSPGVSSAKERDGATACVQSSTARERALAKDFCTNRINFRPVVSESLKETRAAFTSGRSDVATNNASSLASFRFPEKLKAEQSVMLLEIISKEPLGPVVRKANQRFFDIVCDALFAQITAEKRGVASRTSIRC